MRWSMWMVAGLAVGALGCSSSKGAERSGGTGGVKVRAARVDMKEPRFADALAEVVLVVDNEGGSPIQLKGATLKGSIVGLEGEFEGAMQPKGDGMIPAGGSAEVPVEVTLTYPADPAAYLEFVKKPVQNIKVSGVVSTAGGDIPVEGTTDFPTPRLLEGKVKDAQMASIDEGAAGDITMELILSNPNAFPVKSEKWDLVIKVDGKELKTTEVAHGETLQPNAGVAYVESFKIDAESWGPDFKEVLKKPEVPYEVTGTITVGGVSYPAQITGSMTFHR